VLKYQLYHQETPLFKVSKSGAYFRSKEIPRLGLFAIVTVVSVMTGGGESVGVFSHELISRIIEKIDMKNLVIGMVVLSILSLNDYRSLELIFRTVKYKPVQHIICRASVTGVKVVVPNPLSRRIHKNHNYS
jgi:hypothetical protein